MTRHTRMAHKLSSSHRAARMRKRDRWFEFAEIDGQLVFRRKPRAQAYKAHQASREELERLFTRRRPRKLAGFFPGGLLDRWQRKQEAGE